MSEQSGSVVKYKQTYTFEAIHYADGTVKWIRTNDGFTGVQLLGILNFISIELVKQINGEIPKPDTIERRVVNPPAPPPPPEYEPRMETPKTMKYEIFKDRKGQYRFRLVARNGVIIAQSEGYKAKRNAKKVFNSLQTIILDGTPLKLVDLTK